MKTVRRMFYAEIFGSVSFVAAAFLSLSFFIDFVDELQKIGRGGYTSWLAVLSAFVELPGNLYELLPIAVLIGTIYALARMAQEKKLATLLVTHDLHLAIELAEQIAVMYAGEIVEQGNIRKAPDAQHPYTRALFEIIPDIKEGKKEFRVIPGEVPDLREQKNECYFRPRCPRAGEKCGKAHPELTGDKHKVRCFYPY